MSILSISIMGSNDQGKGVQRGNLPLHGSSFVLIGKMQTLVGGGGMALMAHSNAAQNACRGTLVYFDDKAGRPQQGSGCDKWIINNCA